jgi:hypothetical protein
MERYRLVLGLAAEATAAHAAELSALDAAGIGNLSALLEVVGKSLTSCEADPRAGSTPDKGTARKAPDRNAARRPFSSRRRNARSRVASR